MRKITILAIFVLVVGLTMGLLAQSPGPAEAATTIVVNDDSAGSGSEPAPCNVAPDFTTVQGGVDEATDAAGDTVLICPGEYSEEVTITIDDLTLTGLPGAILDGTSLAGAGSRFGITIDSGVDDVIIEGLEIRDFLGSGGSSDRSSAIVAANGNTSNITIKDNNLHDNFWNGLLVFSNGVPTNHTNWTVEENTATDNGEIGIELTNCSGCVAKENEVSGSGRAGIVIQARNTVSSNPGVTVSNVLVEENEVFGSGAEGIFVLALGSGPLSPFPPISNGGAVLNVVVKENEVDNAGVTGIRVLGFGNGTVTASQVLENEVEDSGTWGIRVQELSGGGAGGNTLSENEAEGSGTFDCIDNTSGAGTASTDNTWTENEGTTSSPAGLCTD